MANLKEIRNRITSISSTMQITSAMKMVSAAKLKKAQDAIIMLRPYSEKLQEIIENVNSNADSDHLSVYATHRPVKRILYIAISSNRGLCGGFNSNVLKELNIQFKKHENLEIEVLTVGKKVFDQVKKTKTIYENQSKVFDALSFETVSQLSLSVMNDFVKAKFDEVHLVYNKFINAALQEIKTEQVLPISLSKSEENTENKLESDYLFEPNRKYIIDSLIPKSIKTQIFKAILDSVASEHGARMTAMHKATDNAQSLKNDLVIFYNKARQASITNEILEIVSGAEALNSK